MRRCTDTSINNPSTVYFHAGMNESKKALWTGIVAPICLANLDAVYWFLQSEFCGFGWRIWMVYLDGVLSLSEWQLLDWPWSLWHPPPCPACWPSDHSLTCFLISQMNDQQRDVCYKKTVKWGNFLKSGTLNEFSPEAFLFSSIFFYFLLFLLFSPLKTFKV